MYMHIKTYKKLTRKKLTVILTYLNLYVYHFTAPELKILKFCVFIYYRQKRI